MNRKSWILVSLLVVILCFAMNSLLLASNADSVLNGLRIEGKMHYGIILPHTNEVKYVVHNNISGAEITLSTQSNNRHPWEGLYRYPRYGIGYNYNDFRNENILGKAHSLFGYIDIPFYNSDRKFSLNYQIGFGISYFPVRYHPYENPLNHAISLPVNYYVSFDVNGRIKVGEKNEIKTAFELSHYSNGKTKSPNYGLNTFTLSVAWLYSIIPSQEINVSKIKVPYKKHMCDIVASAGWKRDDMLTERVYKVASLAADYSYFFSQKYAIGGGADLFYDESVQATREASIDYVEEPGNANVQAGLHMGFRVRYGRMQILLQAGHYVYADYLKYTLVYSRVGMRYAVTENLLLNFTLKSHMAIADYLEWGIGYRFNSKGI